MIQPQIRSAMLVSWSVRSYTRSSGSILFSDDDVLYDLMIMQARCSGLFLFLGREFVLQNV